jgi:hypothetical protein
MHIRKHGHGNQRGSAMLEFALVMAFLVPVFVATFSVGMSLTKSIQATSVCRDAAVLMVRSNTDPSSGLDLSLTQNQRMIIRAANGFRMNLDAAFDPDPSGKGVLILSKVVFVGPAECSVGIVPAPPTAPPWNSGNCPNYGQYAFTYRVVIGNGTTWTSKIGSPPSGIVAANGTISAADIASNTSNRATGMGAGGVVTLTASTFALISEMFVDVSDTSLFSTWQAPIIYSRSVS